ncbi:Kelch repeat-containing protein [Lachnellula willkommii]|uniref:Kelch repeat-containing protein n=1 Tax=Lachnellula willkommii TaxID=215461 RepID=A0A559M670_9HELO|nr:Kelch repeat-containing protein [Lachnellula willkommii]
MIRSQSILLAVGLFAKQCVAQAAGWQAGQVNTTMCYWDSPRAGVIRDTLYIDGGMLWWLPGMSDGSYGDPVSDGNPLGLVYLLNFSTSFDTSVGQNLSSTAFTNISKAANGGAANNIGPQYYDGTMFANDYEWITYGGLLSKTDAFKDPAEDSVPAYQEYPQVQKQFSSGYTLGTTSTGTTRYVTNGAGVSVPSENLGFYMGGLRSPTSGPIYYQPINSSVAANVLSETLIQVDMSTEGQEIWTNNSLPTSVPGRANAELVWVPVSEKGVLVAVGGVIDPVFANINLTLNASDTADSKMQSPKFTSTVSVYDIAKQSWYEQDTTGSPGQLTQGCAVLASSQDGTSHNIYWYGGFDGINLSGNFSDDVWILSVPSFMWMKVYSGVSSHGRAGHRCIKPYPDQMFVIGGYASYTGATPTCVAGNVIQIFNLSSSDWITSYNPKIWSNYTVPSMIAAMIGGTGTGSATQTAPSPSGFANSSLTAVFASPYNASKIVQWYPYTPSTTPDNNRTTILPSAVAKSGGTPSYLAPVLGVVLGLFFVTLLVLAFLLWRRRRIFRQNGTGTQSEAGTLDNRRWVTNWLRATPVDAKAPTVTTDETQSSPYEEDVSRADRVYIPEMAGKEVHEMMDTSMPTELGAHDTGFVPLAAGAAAKGRKGVTHSPSTGSHASHASQASSISRMSRTSAPRPGISPVHQLRADSPPLGESASVDDTGTGRVASGVSVTSSSHLRGISDTSVSTEGGAYATPGEGLNLARRDLVASAPEGNTRPNVVSPLTPPLQEASDYLTASPTAPANTSNRKSQFSEKLDEVGGGK